MRRRYTTLISKFLISVLIKHGANLECKFTGFYTPVYIAAQKGYFFIFPRKTKIFFQFRRNRRTFNQSWRQYRSTLPARQYRSLRRRSERPLQSYSRSPRKWRQHRSVFQLQDNTFRTSNGSISQKFTKFIGSKQKSQRLCTITVTIWSTF